MIAWTTSWIFFCFFEEKDWSLSQSCPITSTTCNFWFAIWIFAYKLAFWFGAFRFCALPIASWFFTYSFTFWFRYLTMSYAMRWLTYIYTFWAIHEFTSFIWTHWFTIRPKYINNNLLFYLSHFTSQIAAFGSKQLEWHFGGSQTGVHTASHLGSSHFHEHSGWHF